MMGVQPISAAILAGGRATRFAGADKASLRLGGARILDRQLAVLATLGPLVDDIRIVTNEQDRYADLRLPIVPDAIAGAGPLGGLYTALIGARHDCVLVLACDLPFVTAALLARLAGGSDDAGIDAVVPRTQRGLEPLCAIYHRRCAAAARACIETGNLRMTALLAGLRVRELGPDASGSVEDGNVFENVNTPHDYARAQALVALNEKPSEDRITE
jgi:molybdopterin-guanine dinucleotide biosynthesis protein A